jgi:hypothetical protein
MCDDCECDCEGSDGEILEADDEMNIFLVDEEDMLKMCMKNFS